MSAGRLALTLWVWLGAVAGVSLLAWRFGAEIRTLGGVAVVALAPVLAGFILLGRMGEAWARAYFLLAWALSAAMLVALTGGATSPAVLLFTIPPAFALSLGGPRLIAGAALMAALGYGAAAWIGLDGASGGLGLAPVLLAFAGLALNAFVLANARSRRETDSASLRIAEAAHELRTPVNHIVGFADMIENQVFGATDPRYVEYAGLIGASGGQLLELINRRLDLSRIEAGRYALELETVDVNESIREVVALSEGSASAKLITMDVELPSAPLEIRADPGAVRQILTNIIGNAVKFTPEGGRVGVAARRRGDSAIVEITDTGPGIPAHERARLGRPFERGEAGRDAEGSGLGLALARALASLHGGALRLMEASGRGALVQLRLPVSGPRDQRGA